MLAYLVLNNLVKRNPIDVNRIPIFRCQNSNNGKQHSENVTPGSTEYENRTPKINYMRVNNEEKSESRILVRNKSKEV